MNEIVKNQHYNVDLEYAEIRSRNAQTSDERKKEVYENHPDIEELTTHKTSCYVAATRALFAGRPQIAEQKRIEANNMAEEINRRLAEYGYAMNYLDPIYDCPNCQDKGYTDDGNRCNCYGAKLATQLYHNSMIDTKFETENFENFKLEYYSDVKTIANKKSPRQNMIDNLAKVHLFIENYDSKHGNLLLSGPPGLGKTFLLSCIAKAMMDRQCTVAYYSANDYIELMKKTKFSYKSSIPDMDIAEYVESCDVLIIDDLGTEIGGEMTKTFVYSMVNTRMRNNKSTIISTNLKSDELAKRYTSRVTSRIGEVYDILPFYGDDIRMMIRHS